MAGCGGGVRGTGYVYGDIPSTIVVLMGTAAHVRSETTRQSLMSGKIGATTAGIVINVPLAGGKVDARMLIKEGNGKELVIIFRTIVDDRKIHPWDVIQFLRMLLLIEDKMTFLVSKLCAERIE